MDKSIPISEPKDASMLHRLIAQARHCEICASEIASQRDIASPSRIYYALRNAQGHVVYTLEVSFRGAVWQLRKRFNDFLNMNQQLKRELPRADVGQLPERRFFGR